MTNAAADEREAKELIAVECLYRSTYRHPLGARRGRPPASELGRYATTPIMADHASNFAIPLTNPRGGRHFSMLSGAPGAGKTTLAVTLAASLSLPVFSKNHITETLADCADSARALV